jgi:hypothetical protein
MLKERRVSHLYLRSPALHADLEQLTKLILSHGIMPIVSRTEVQSPLRPGCGIHTRSKESFKALPTPSGSIQTASCHSAEDAAAVLDKGADYVFISPVYRPFSKPGDRRPLIATDELRMLSRRYGQRIVLLGGLTPKRISELRTMLDADFSVAGISMFFNTGITHEHNPNADIRQ